MLFDLSCLNSIFFYLLLRIWLILFFESSDITIMMTLYLQKTKEGSLKFFTLIQKQPYRSILRKRCSENMQQIYRRTPMPKCNFIGSCFATLLTMIFCFATLLNLHFGMRFLLQICSIFSKHLFLRAPLKGCLYWQI